MCDFLDETEVFWKTLPDKAFGQKIKEYKVGKKCKQRFAITFIIMELVKVRVNLL